jgi:hypothetical protein
MSSILFCPTIRLNEDGDTAQPSIEIEFNYVRNGTEEPKLEFVSSRVKDYDYLNEYLSTPAWEHGLAEQGENLNVADVLAMEWLEDDGYEKAVAAVQEGWT